FLDARESSFCRPTFYEALHRADGIRAQLAHVGWPWVSETIGVLSQELMVYGEDPSDWQLRTDVSFGPPADWQLPTWQLALDSLPPEMLIYGSDVFWPVDANQYVERYLQIQLGLYEVAMTRSHMTQEGSP